MGELDKDHLKNKVVQYGRKIKKISVEKSDITDDIEKVRVDFGPHHYIEIYKSENERVFIKIGYTHHGIVFDGSDVDGSLEKMINHVREKFPLNIYD